MQGLEVHVAACLGTAETHVVPCCNVYNKEKVMIGMGVVKYLQ